MQPSEWREDSKAKQCCQRNDRTKCQIVGRIPPATQTERHIFTILLGAKMLAAVMVDVRVIHERRNQEWNAAQQIPSNAKGAKLLLRQMHQLMNEERRTVKQQR